ncbi:MAG: DsbA family protein [Sulfuricaulis sp.]|nr:DsbA family protein [Sulfuricaulis sp.]
MSPERILWYFADPMCSWCWGFSPAISAIKESYSDRLKIALMLGGLRPGTTEPVTPKFREETLHHWRDVHKMTGQPFTFEAAMPEGFVYDTEPASRAVIAVAGIDPEAIFPYFKSVQAAFYAQGRDVTRTGTLADLAAHLDIDKPRFLERFESEDIKNKTRAHFRITREAGVRGFPTIVLQAGSGQKLLANGCRPLEELRPELEAWLAETA